LISELLEHKKIEGMIRDAYKKKKVVKDFILSLYQIGAENRESTQE
jgi:hypothetical protein